MAGIGVGHVTHYSGDLHVAVIALSDMVHVGDWLHLCGHTTDFVQPVQSLEIHHQPVALAGPGDEVALTVNDRVRVNDMVFRITTEEMRRSISGKIKV